MEYRTDHLFFEKGNPDQDGVLDPSSFDPEWESKHPYNDTIVERWSRLAGLTKR